GLFILYSRYNLVAYVLALELLLLGTNLIILLGSFYSTTYVTTINFVLLLIAAIETAVGLSLIINLQKYSYSIEIPLALSKN
ncbi:MAG TPA: NADH-quinone oxidoreductase subunit K, partial [Mycoplasmatales bacterium]|nr:NADH-quinone oxidoreductase subunit K [Mycoplasmatales bacterium]